MRDGRREGARRGDAGDGRSVHGGGEAWLREHVAPEPWQVFGGMIACELRYVVDVIDGMVEDGLEVVFG